MYVCMYVCMYVLYIFICMYYIYYIYLYPIDTGQVIKDKKCEHALLLHTTSYTVRKWNVFLYSQLI